LRLSSYILSKTLFSVLLKKLLVDFGSRFSITQAC
jgi:hypothetical protein